MLFLLEGLIYFFVYSLIKNCGEKKNLFVEFINFVNISDNVKLPQVLSISISIEIILQCSLMINDCGCVKLFFENKTLQLHSNF